MGQRRHGQQDRHASTRASFARRVEAARFRRKTRAPAAFRLQSCNADGVFNMLDYAQDPRFTPIVTGEKCFTNMDPTMPPANAPGSTERVDLNRKLQSLDPGDLIEMFSDGKDDDGNAVTS